MKVLFVSLQRIGDLIYQESLIEQYSKDHPGHQLHLLTNDSSHSYAQTIEYIQRFHAFPRERLQSILIEENRPTLLAYTELAQLVSFLNGLNFDLIINLTHTRVAWQMVKLLQAPDKRGQKLEHPWLQYLNENFASQTHPSFQQIDILARALAISSKMERPPKSLKIGSTGPAIAFQLLTSDKKKNWGLENFRALMQLIRRNYPQARIYFLGAPSEAPPLESFFKSEIDSGLIELKILVWKELKKFLDSLDLLVTGDTSVQHLAAQIQLPMISLFLGSANSNKMIPQMIGAKILQPTTSCFPCEPRNSCHRDQHICAQDLKVESVYREVNLILSQQNYLGNSQSRIVCHSPLGFWGTRADSKSFDATAFSFSLGQLIWQTYLDLGSGPLDARTTALRFFEKGFDLNDPLDFKIWTNWLRQRRRGLSAHIEFYRSCKILVETGTGFNPIATLKDEYQQHWMIWANDLWRKDYFQKYFCALEEIAADKFIGLSHGRVKSALREANELLEIEAQILTELEANYKTRNDERKESYVKGARYAFELGSEAT